MTRRGLLGGIAGCVLLAPACRARGPTARHGILHPHPFNAEWAYDAHGETLRLEGCSSGCACLISYDVPPDHEQHERLRLRSFVYDDCLGILLALSRGRQEEAAALGNTLVSLVMPDAGIGFSFNAASPTFYNAGYVRAGTVAWTGYALARLAGRTGSGSYRTAAERLAMGLLATVCERRDDRRKGLVPAGRGRWDRRSWTFDSHYVADFCVAEHQIDAYFMLRELGTVTGERTWFDRAERLADALMDALWIEAEGRFAAGVSETGTNEERALDAAGAWGTLFLLARGDHDRARRCLRFTRDTFRTRVGNVDGFMPYAGSISDYPGRDFSQVLFLEGTVGVGIALARSGFEVEARTLAEGLRRLTSPLSGGLPYALPGDPDFPNLVAVAPTAWLGFLDDELKGEPPGILA